MPGQTFSASLPVRRRLSSGRAAIPVPERRADADSPLFQSGGLVLKTTGLVEALAAN